MRFQLDPTSLTGVSIAPEQAKITNQGGFAGSPDITRVLQAGTNVTFTGNGSQQSPYIVNATGGGGGSVNTVTAGDATITVAGTATDPTVAVNAIPESKVTNLVSDLAGKQATGNYITALTSDITASGPGSVAATLATVNSTVGSFGSASSVATQTVNAKGLTTAAASVPIVIAESAVTNLTADLAAKEVLTNKVTDFTTINNTLYPTVQAVNNAINTATIGLLDYRGSYDASTNLFPATGGSGLAGAILKGDFWICSVGGTLGGTVVTPGDLIIALTDTPAQTAANWDLIEHDLGYVPENVANKSTTTTLGASNTLYPTQNAVKVYADTKVGTVTAADGSITIAGTSTAPTVSRAALTGDVTASAGSNSTTLASGSAAVLNSGTLLAARLPALTGDITTTVGTVATTLASIVTGTTVGDATHIPVITYDNKGRITGTTTASPSATAPTQRTFAYYAG